MSTVCVGVNHPLIAEACFLSAGTPEEKGGENHFE